MTAVPKLDLRISPEEYIDGELVSEMRHEYIDGDVYAMAGASRVHNLIARNAVVSLTNSLRGRKCTPFGSDMKVRLPAAIGDIFYYPDVSVTCDPTDNATYYLERPSVIVEVLSPETRRVDTREKRAAYLLIPSLEHYLMLEQDGVGGVLLSRDGEAWRETVLTDPAATVELAAIGFSIPLADLYEGTGLADGR